MKRLLVLTCVAVLAACDKGTDGGLKVEVTIGATVKTNCIALEIQKVGDGTLLASTIVPRPAGDGPIAFAVRQADLPAKVQVQAVGYSGAQCDDAATRKLVSRGELKTVDFPLSGIEVVALPLGPPDATIDADRDGVVALSKGGIDCDDTNAMAYPGATQLCDSPLDLNCDGDIYCADAACSTSSVCMRPPDRLVFINPAPTGVKRFDCSPAIVIQSQDALGVAAVTRRVSLTLVGSLAGTEFFSDATCTAALPDPAIDYGTTQTTLYTKASSFGAQTLTLSATGLTGATHTFLIEPQAVAGFAFVPTATSTMAGDCTQLTLMTTDAQGRATPSPTPITASLAASPAPGTAFFADSDSTCQTQVASVTFSGGNDTVKLRVKSQRATSPDMPLAINAIASTIANMGTLALTVRPGAPTQLAFTTQAPGLVVQSCSGAAVRVGVRDQFGNQTTVPTETVVTLTWMRLVGISAALSYSLDANCTDGTPSLQATIAANQAESVPVAIKGSAIGTIQMIANAPTLTAGTQVATIAMGAPSAIRITSAPRTATAGECSLLPIVIETQDMSNARSAVQGSNLNIELSGTSLTFFGNDSCSTPLPGSSLVIPVGSAEGRVFFRGDIANPSIEVVAVTNNSAYMPPGNEARQNQVVNAGPPYSLVWKNTTSRSAVSGVCSGAYSLELRDRTNNLTRFSAPQAVSLGSAPSGVTLGGNAGCSTTSLTFPSSSSQVDLYASAPLVNTYALTAVAGGINSSTPAATLTITPGPYASLAYLTPTFPRAVTAGTCQEVTVQRRDSAGNATPVSGATEFQLTTVATGLTTFASAANCAANSGALTDNKLSVSSGATATFWVRPTIVQPTSIAVASLAISAGAGALTISPAAASSLVWVTPSNGVGSLTAGGCLAASLERRDAFGNQATEASALAIPFTLGGVPGTVSANGTCSGSVTSLSIAASSPRVNFSISSSTAGTLTMTPSSAVSNPTPANITVNPGTATALVYTVSPGATQITAGTCTQLTVERRDGVGNAVPFSGTFTIVLPAGMTAYRNNSNCMATDQATTTVPVTNGAQATFWVRPTGAGSNAVTINDGALSAMTSVVTVAAGQASINWSASTPTSTTAGACLAMTLERRDAFGNLASAGTLAVTATSSGTANATSAFSSAADCSNASGSPFTVNFSNGDTQRTFYVTTQRSGTLSITPSGVFSTAQRDLTVSAGSAATLVLLATPGSNPAGTCISNSLEAHDSYGNRAAPGSSGLVVSLSAAAGSADFFTSGSCGTAATSVTIPADGSTTGFGFRPTSVGTVTIQATGTGVTTASQNWTATAGLPTRLDWKTLPAASPARFACTTAELQAEDDYGNPVDSPAAPGSRTLNIASSSGAPGLVFYASADCSGAAVSSISLPASSAGLTFSMLGIGTGSSNVTVTDATGGGLGTTPVAGVSISGAATEALVVAAANTEIEYFDCDPVTITRQVSAANWSRGTTALTLSSASSSISVHADSNCNNAIGTPTIADGSASVTVYVKGHSGTGSVTITAADNGTGFADGTLSVTALPLVRRGTCSLDASMSVPQTVNCPIGTTIPSGVARTFMVYQASVDSSSPRDGSVRCKLDNASNIECRRAGNAAGAPAATIRWQTVTMGRAPSGAYTGGMSVQHFNNDNENSAAGSIDITTSSVTRSRSFLLFSHSNSGDTFGNSDWVTAKFKDDTHVTLTTLTQFADLPLTYSLQVVELDGITVDRGGGSATNQSTFNISSTSFDVSRTFVLSTARFAGDGADFICKRSLRVDLPSATEVRFTRSASSATAACLTTDVGEVAWERIQMPNTNAVRTCTVQVASSGSNSCTVGGAGLTHHRMLLLSGQQGLNGQASGDTAFDTGDNFGYATATLDYSGMGNRTITATRGSGGVPRSDFTPFVIQFAQ